MSQRIRMSPSRIALGLTILALLAVQRFGSVTLAAPICVNPGGTGGCFATIQGAVSSAAAGDTVRVATGVYSEVLLITKTLTLEGGWNAAFTVRDTAATPSTIRPNNPPGSVVSIQGSIADTSLVKPIVDGFTISGGAGGNHGGGLRVVDSDALVKGNTITGNSGYLYGGGVWVQRGAPVFDGNRVVSNTVLNPSSYGGGFELEDSRARLANNLIGSNVVSATVGYGGGVAVLGGGPVTLVGNTILKNDAGGLASGDPTSDRGKGGGIYVSGAAVNATGNLIQENRGSAITALGPGGGPGYGGGVFVTSASTVTFTSNAILSNTAGFRLSFNATGGGVQIESSTGVFADNVIAGNSANGNMNFGDGGGLAAYSSRITVKGGKIAGNNVAVACEGNGGGLFASGSSVTLDTVRFESNCASNTAFYGLGGAMAFFTSPFTITNLLVANNSAFATDDRVGGLYAGAESPGIAINNTFADNRGQGIRTGSPLTFYNNIVSGHTTGISLTAGASISATYNDFFSNTINQKGFSPDASNLVVDPKLTAGYHLAADSPLIDAGRNAGSPSRDFDGEPRPAIGTSGFYRVDIGADERSGSAQRRVTLESEPPDLTIIGPGNPNTSSNGSNDWIGYSAAGGAWDGSGKAGLLFAAEDWAEDFDTLNATGRLFGLSNFGHRITGTIDLISATTNLTVVGQYIRQHMGAALQIGDLNGDGIPDIVAGSYENDNDNTVPVTPTAIVLFGGTGLTGTRTLTEATPADFRLRAPKQDFVSFSGKNQIAIGDISGDGIGDLVVADSLADDGGTAGTGAAFIVFGSATLSGLRDLKNTPADFTVFGPAAAAKLGAVAVGNLSNDSQPDLAARNDTSAFIVFGPRPAGALHLSSANANVRINGLQAGEIAIGDVTGDGKDDLILGSGDNTLVLPGPFSDGAVLDASAAATLVIHGASGRLTLGNIVGDGTKDLIIGNFQKQRVWVIAGGAGFQGAHPVDEIAVMILSAESSGYRDLGFDLGTGDLDNDGRQDLIVTTWGVMVDHPMKFMDAGKVLLFYGSATLAPPGTPPPGGAPPPDIPPGGVPRPGNQLVFVAFAARSYAGGW